MLNTLKLFKLNLILIATSWNYFQSVFSVLNISELKLENIDKISFIYYSLVSLEQHILKRTWDKT